MKSSSITQDTNTRIAITKNGLTKLSAPPALNLENFQTENKITDEEVLKILEQPLSGSKPKNKNKKKKPAKKAGEAEADEE